MPRYFNLHHSMRLCTYNFPIDISSSMSINKNCWQVVFLALDAHVKNVACTYSLEHESIDHNFDSVFYCLNALEGSENTSKALQELVFCIGAIQASICQHMLKEEKQVTLLFIFISYFFLLFFFPLHELCCFSPISLPFVSSLSDTQR